MKFVEENLGTIAMGALIAFVTVVGICLIAGNIKMALIAFGFALFCGAVSNAVAYEEALVEYYYEEEEELD